MFQFITFTQIGQVGKIVLNRPDVLNSFTMPMAKEFQKAMDICANDKNIRAVYITGNGRAFCAGQDLAEATAKNAPKIEVIVEETYNPIILKIRNIEKPVICAVNGVAAGAGANIAIACDITFAAKSANFIQAFSKIGLIPDSAGTFFLPRLIGLQKTTALMMLGDKLSATDAASMGLIYQVFEDEELQEKAFAIAENLSKMPTKGLGLTKRALNQSLSNNLEQQLAVEKELQSEAGKTFDNKEGINAFLEKRKPNFIGA